MTLPAGATRAHVREAKRLAKSIRDELKAGSRHISPRTGLELTTVAEIAFELAEYGHVVLDLPEGRPQPWYLRVIRPAPEHAQ